MSGGRGRAGRDPALLNPREDAPGSGRGAEGRPRLLDERGGVQWCIHPLLDLSLLALVQRHQKLVSADSDGNLLPDKKQEPFGGQYHSEPEFPGWRFSWQLCIPVLIASPTLVCHLKTSALLINNRACVTLLPSIPINI